MPINFIEFPVQAKVWGLNYREKEPYPSFYFQASVKVKLKVGWDEQYMFAEGSETNQTITLEPYLIHRIIVSPLFFGTLDEHKKEALESFFDTLEAQGINGVYSDELGHSTGDYHE